MKKIISILLVIGLCLTAFVGCSDNSSEESILDQDVLKIGMEMKYPPFEGKDENGEPVGASIDLGLALGEYLGMEVEFVDTPYPSLIPALENSEFDIIISSMTITEEREKKIDFSIPYTTSDLMLLVNADSSVESYADLDDEDITIVVKSGTVSATWAENNAPNANIVGVQEEATAVLEVSQGKADAFIYDPLSIINHHENYPDTTRAILEPLPNTQGWGIAMRKGNEDLQEKINEFIEKAQEDGTYEQIRENHLLEEMKEFEKYDLDFFF